MDGKLTGMNTLSDEKSEALTLPEKKNGSKPERVLFVCTGNTCRSPMAEAVLKALGKEKYEVSSAGLSAYEGEPINPCAVSALEGSGIEATPKNDYKKHKARNVDSEMLIWADVIVPMTGGHTMRLLLAYPSVASKLSPFSKEIPDPFGRGKAEYEKCLSVMTEEIKRKFEL